LHKSSLSLRFIVCGDCLQQRCRCARAQRSTRLVLRAPC